MKILILDNYDSFTYNLHHLLESIVQDTVDVYRNDALTLSEIGTYDKIILSPGPHLPDDTPILKELLARFASEKDILGICLGHQAIAEFYGCRLRNLSHVHHGTASRIKIDTQQGEKLFKGLPTTIEVGHYHSWVVDEQCLPSTLTILARTLADDQIMALRHTKDKVWGIQFHPESILTPLGHQILYNWVYR